MPPKDKYTVFSPHAVGYRKGIHKVPKWTRVRSPHLSLQLSNLNGFRTANSQGESKRLLGSIQLRCTPIVY